MKRKNSFMCLVLLVMLLLISSCSLIEQAFGILPDNEMGKLLSVDSSGHFKDEIVYDFSDWKVVYGTDGTYTQYSYEYSETTEDFILGEELIGTYSWNPDTLLVEFYFDYYVEGVTGDAYTVDYTGELTKYYTDSNSGAAYVLTGSGDDTWEYTREYEYSDGAVSSYSYSYTIAGTSISYEYLYEYKDSTGALTNGTNREIEYDVIDTYPEGDEWTIGKVVTFNVEETIDREAVVSSGVFGDWTYNALERTSLSMGNMGNSMFFNSSSSSKEIEKL